MARQVLLHASDETTAAAAVNEAGGRLLHVFTPQLFVAELPAEADPRGLPNVSLTPAADASELETLLTRAWEGLQQQQASARFALSGEPALKWDTPGFEPPDRHGDAEGARFLALEGPEVARSTGTPTSLYLTGKVAVGVVIASGGNWTQVSGALTWVSVGQDGTVWGVNSASNIYRWTGSAWQQIPGALVQISVGNANNVWGVNAAGNIYRWTGSAWQQIPGALRNVSVAPDGTVWGVNSAGNIYKYLGSNQWQQIAGALVQISVANASTIWGTNAQNQIYRWNGGGWTQVPGALTVVSAAFDGSVFGVNAAGNIYRYISSSNSWQQMPGGLAQISAASVSSIWGVNAGQNIYTGNASSGLSFAASEIQTVMSEVQEGLNFLASAEPLANVTFYYDWKTVNVSATPGPDPSITNPYETMEAPWRNAALVAMGYPGSTTGSQQYVAHIKQQYSTNWAYVAYFTKYPLQHFAYQLSERLVMQYSNDGWGPERINQVFAHESCHVFGAADEYGSCGCGNSGYYNIKNGNCVNCTSSQQACLMNANTLSLCNFSRGQIGWSTWNQISGNLRWVSVGSDGTVWGVNTANNIYRYAGNQWQQIPGALRQISVGNANNVWGVNAAGNIYFWTGSAWQQVAGALTNVSVAPDGTVWGVNSAGNIYRRSGSTWQQIPGALVQISVGSASIVWGVNAAGNIYRWTGSTWQQIPGALTCVAAASDGTVWGVNSAGNIYRYNSGSNNWTMTAGGLSEISVGAAPLIWGVNSAGNIYQRLVLATP
jgi:hypothetical protein